MVRRIVPLVVVWMCAVAYATGDAQFVGSLPGRFLAAAAPAPQSAQRRTPKRSARKAPRKAATPVVEKVAAAAPLAPLDPAFPKQYCMTCHNDRAKVGGLSIESLDLVHVDANAEQWEKVVRKIKTGMMPPSGAPRPERAALDSFAAALETHLDSAADPKSSLETPALHRLNRAEYKNAVRDLLDVDVDVSPLLPADGSSEGFDNLAEALGVSPALIQGYVSAAMKISRLAVGDRTMAPSQVVYAAPPGFSQDRHIDGLPIGTRGGMLIHHTFPLDAEYEFTLGGGGPGGGGAAGGTDITIDGAKLAVQNTRKFRIQVPAGPHVIGVALLDRQRGAGVDDAYSDFRSANNGFTTAGGVQNVAIMGPFNPKGAGETPSRRRIFTCHPTAASEEEPCARSILSNLARRAYRGVVSAGDVDTLLSFFREGRKGGDFETGIQTAVARVLVAPRFIYRMEEEPGGAPAGSIYRITDLELASRLSFFLWSSIPDDDLLALAAKGKLREPATLQAQVKRMLMDPKADAFIQNFAGQWLYLRDLANVQTEAPGWDDNLRQGFRRETEMLFGSIVREDRSLVNLLDADYTFVDERLAKHYGIPNVRGSYFRRVPLDASSPRRGLFGQGSILTITSSATRTSPVIRGKWILENLLGAPPPQPPPGVETNLGEGEEIAKTTTVRQRLERHRASPTCAACHSIMDPLGFALENYDLIGAWREKDGPSKVDTQGRLADGTPINGPLDLRRAVLSRSEAFLTVATEKLFVYALGRPVKYYDMPTIRTVVHRAARDDNRFSSFVLGIVESDAFQKRIKKS